MEKADLMEYQYNYTAEQRTAIRENFGKNPTFTIALLLETGGQPVLDTIITQVPTLKSYETVLADELKMGNYEAVAAKIVSEAIKSNSHINLKLSDIPLKKDSTLGRFALDVNPSLRTGMIEGKSFGEVMGDVGSGLGGFFGGILGGVLAPVGGLLEQAGGAASQVIGAAGGSTTTTTQTGAAAEKSNTTMWLVIGGGVLILAVVLILVFTSKK